MGDVGWVRLTNRERLTPQHAEKQAFHLELDLRDTPIHYQVGDCLAVYPENPIELLETLFSRFSSVHPEMRKKYTHGFDLLQVSQSLEENYGSRPYAVDYSDCFSSLEELAVHLLPMKPRFYSIASSMTRVGSEAHLIVTLNRNPLGHPVPYGICSSFLCERARIDMTLLHVVHYPTRHFRPPALDVPMVMIGPGTGIAPFRGFMQERTSQSQVTKNWLFFGEQTRSGHYYYSKDWEEYQAQGWLQIDLAFSRESESKIYVQDRMYERKSQLWEWIDRHQASLFICGDAKKMATSVEAKLLKIIEEEGHLSPSDATLYLKQLRKSGRYLRDVY